MALTTEQIDAEAFARWGDMKGAPLAMCRGFARAIEAEVRKDDEALILQLVEALCECAEDSQEQLDRMEAARLRDYKPNAIAWQEDTIAKAKAAIVAGRARLEGKP